MIDVDIDFETHEYCERCGNKMSPTFLVDAKPYSYNKNTGHPMFMIAKRCPYYDTKTARGVTHDFRTSYTEEVAPSVQ